MCHDMCKCFGRVGENREGMEIGRCWTGGWGCSYLRRSAKRATVDADRLGSHVKDFNPRSREGSDSNIIQQISFSLYNTVYFVSNNIK